MARASDIGPAWRRHFCAITFRARAFASPARRASILVVLVFWASQSGTAKLPLLADEPQLVQTSSYAAEVAYRPGNASVLRTPSSGRSTDRLLSNIAPNRVMAVDSSQSLPAVLSTRASAADMPAFATTTWAAGDLLVEEVHERLQENDLLVVWLLDSSHSMADARDQLAVGLDSFSQHFARRPENSHRLLHAAVAFGSDMSELVAPTQSGDRIAEAVRRLSADPTGVENTFEAIEKCAAKYRSAWPDLSLLIITWTDESGDDSGRLENTIKICQDNRVSVTVIGPMAVLGADTATEPFVDHVVHETHQLPVARGQDSAMPERLELGYWFLTQQPDQRQIADRGFDMADLPAWFGAGNRVFGDHKCIAATQVELPTWHGDADLTGLVSGFGPYTLTRLAVQTGGTYIILADDAHAGPFRPDTLRAYLPDYRSVEAYRRDIESSPLRRAVLEAVKITRGKTLGPPPTLLFGKRSETPPFGFMRDYYTPERFANKVKMVRRRLQTEASQTSKFVDQALEQVSSAGELEVGLEKEYEQETSHRWRAWYDLTRGRLLATSVRLEAYRKTFDALVEPGFLEQTTNFAVLVPSRKITVGSTHRFRAEEAERLLLRCIRENPNTPWALLAQRELDYGLGIDALQFTTFLVMMPPGNPKEQLSLPKL